MKEKYMIVIFPACQKHWNNINIILNKNLDIVQTMTLNLNSDDKFQLIANLYNGEGWLGNDYNNYDGLYYKLNSCFPNDLNQVKIYSVYTEKTNLLKIKKQIREICEIGNHSIHTTDTIGEFSKLEKYYFK